MKSKSNPSIYYLILSVTLMLLSFGLIMVSSASSAMAYAYHKDSFFYLKRQVVYILFGFILLMTFARYDYRRLKKVSLGLVLLSFLILVSVLIPGIGRRSGGAVRWISWAGFSFQPSELAKLATAIFAADVLSRKKDFLADPRKLVKTLVLPISLLLILVLAQPDLGTAFTIAIIVYFLFFLAGGSWLQVIFLGLGGLSLVTVLIFSAGYRRSRFLSFLNPWVDPQKTGFHIIQSLLAIGSGGITGVGLGFSRQKFGYLPTPFTDFIFAIIGEELGFIGGLVVIFLFILFGLLGLKVARSTKDSFGKLLSGGITAMILSQAIINMGAVTGLLPVTGVPLPLVSFGGSSLLFTLASIGILLNVAKNIPKKRRGTRFEDNDLRGRNRWSHLSGSGSRRSA